MNYPGIKNHLKQPSRIGGRYEVLAKMTGLSIIFFITMCLLNSCRYPCGRGSASIALVNYNDTESDSLILRRFAREGGFGKPIDSFIIDRNSEANFQRMNDTVLVLYGIPNGNKMLEAITSNYNYEVFLPKVNRVYQITDVVENMEYGRRDRYKVYCTNSIKSYRLNGKRFSGKPRYEFIYLDK